MNRLNICLNFKVIINIYAIFLSNILHQLYKNFVTNLLSQITKTIMDTNIPKQLAKK